MVLKFSAVHGSEQILFKLKSVAVHGSEQILFKLKSVAVHGSEQIILCSNKTTDCLTVIGT